MSKIIWISCKQVVEYNQQVTVTDEEYNTLMEIDGNDVHEDYNPKGAYAIISSHLDHSEILDSDDEYLMVQILEDENE